MDQEIKCEVCNRPASTETACSTCRDEILESEAEWPTNGDSPWMGLV